MPIKELVCNFNGNVSINHAVIFAGSPVFVCTLNTWKFLCPGNNSVCFFPGMDTSDHFHRYDFILPISISIAFKRDASSGLGMYIPFSAPHLLNLSIAVDISSLLTAAVDL